MPLIGVSVLGYLFGAASSVPIAVSALVMNIIQVPVTLVLLSIAAAPAQEKRAAASYGAKPAAAAAAPGMAAPSGTRSGADPVSGRGLGLGRHVLAAVKEPVVRMPVAGLVLVLAVSASLPPW